MTESCNSYGDFVFWKHKGYAFYLLLLLLLLGLQVQHMEVPRLGFESELQLPAYATATATQDPSHICNLHYSSWQWQIPDPLSEARNWTHIFLATNKLSNLRSIAKQYASDDDDGEEVQSPRGLSQRGSFEGRGGEGQKVRKRGAQCGPEVKNPMYSLWRCGFYPLPHSVG